MTAQGKLETRVETLAQFASRNGLVTTADVDGHIHAGLRSKPQTKTYQRFYDKKLDELQTARDQTSAAYQDAIASGEVRGPSATERLIATANGHEDNSATQAARRVLEKRGINWRAALTRSRQS
jgi:hypothetical protein